MGKWIALACAALLACAGGSASANNLTISHDWPEDESTAIEAADAGEVEAAAPEIAGFACLVRHRAGAKRVFPKIPGTRVGGWSRITIEPCTNDYDIDVASDVWFYWYEAELQALPNIQGIRMRLGVGLWLRGPMGMDPEADCRYATDADDQVRITFREPGSFIFGGTLLVVPLLSDAACEATLTIGGATGLINRIVRVWGIN